MQITSPAPPPNTNSSAALRLALLEGVRDMLIHLVFSLGFLYVLFAPSHWLFLTGSTRVIMTCMAGFSAAFAFFLYGWLRWCNPPLRFTYVIALVIFIIPLSNSALQLYLTKNILESTNFLFLLVGGGAVLMSSRWFVLVSLNTVAVWGFTLWLLPPQVDLPHWMFAFFTASGVGTIIHVWRKRSMTQMVFLQWEDERHRQALSDSLLMMQQTKQLLQGVLDSALDGILLLVARFDEQQELVDFIIAEINQAASDFIELPREALFGKRFLQVLPKHKNLFEQYRDVFLTGVSFSSDVHIPPDKSASGEERWYMVSAIKNAQGVVVTFSDITSRKRAELEHAELALFDPLTHLFNRRAFEAEAEKTFALADRYDAPVSLLSLDLNDFKPVNDTYGHHVGDALLVEVAKRLRTTVRDTDIVARFGGDEFIVLLYDANEQQAQDMKQRLLAAVERPILVESHTLTVRVSIGVGEYKKHGKTLTDLMRHADIAMYVIKKQLKLAGYPSHS